MSTFSDGKLIVCSQTGLKPYDPMSGFRSDTNSHKKIDLIFYKLTDFGFEFDGYDKKADSFTVSYNKNPMVLYVLHMYAKSIDYSPQTGAGDVKFNSFSYRWVENPSEQKHEPIFLVKMDMSPRELQDIQYWLYDKAKEYGYAIDKKKPFDKNAINYKKGSKQFMLAGEKHFGEEYLGNTNKIFTKVIFRNIFGSHPEKVAALAKKCPGVFGESSANCDPNCKGFNINHCKGENKYKPCSMRILYSFDEKDFANCAYKSFWFFNPTLDSFKDIFELFVIENKVKVM